MASRNIPLTLFGEGAEGLFVYIGTSVTWTLTCQDPYTRLPINLSDGNVKMSLRALDLHGEPAEVVGTWTAAVQGDPALGICVVAWDPAATAAVIVAPATTAGPLPIADYLVDVWRTDVATNRVPLLAPSRLSILGVATMPPGGD